MPIRDLIPAPIKALIRPPYYFIRRRWMYRNPGPIEVSQEYWKKPDEVNAPSLYLSGRKRSAFLVQLLRKYVPVDGSLLELGCNVGRNLNEAFEAGYRDLEGVEINEEAIEIMRQSYPEMAKVTTVHFGRIEDTLRAIMHKDCIFTMAVLVHIHPSSDWVFAEIAKRAETLIIVEDEKAASWRHFARNYKELFEKLGMHQVEEIVCKDIPELITEKGIQDYVARVFKR